jgi:plasmid stabilization system protein ParE
MRLVFTDRAQADLLEAWLYIAEENLAAADRVLDTSLYGENFSFS